MRIRRQKESFYDDPDCFDADEDYDGPPLSSRDSSSANYVDWQNTANNQRQSSPKPFTNKRSPPNLGRPYLVDPWMADGASDDDGRNANRDPYYYSEEEEEDVEAYPPVALKNVASDDDSDLDYYDDENYDTSNLKEPGNFWTNPVQRPDPGPSDIPNNNQQFTTREIRRPRATADRDSRQQRRSGTGRRGTTTFRSGTPPPPKPLADLYHRLFWYGLETDDDLSSSSQEESRTMFGGTKGKFNGLSYLYNGEAIVPPEQRRAVPPRSERRKQGRGSFLPPNGDDFRNGSREEYFEEGEEDIYADEDDSGYDRSRREENDAQRMPRRTKDLITPPRDPPRPVLDRQSSNRRRKRSAVASWWENNDADDEGDDYDASFGDPDDERSEQQQQRPRRRRPQSSSNNNNNWASALDTFLGLDRERLRDQADAYDRRIRNSGSGSGNYRRARSREEDEFVGPSPPSFVSDQRKRQSRPPFQSVVPAPSEVEDIIDAEHVVENRDNEEPGTVNGPSPPSLLTWEERALAVERVPPANVPAWGPMGDLGMDARTKALQDALQDIASAKEEVEDRRRRMTMAQDQLAVLRVDAQLERKRLMRLQSTNDDDFNSERTTLAAREALRRTQRRIEEASRRLRWRQLQWDEAVQELAQVEARHWALLKAYNPEKARQVVEEAWQELEKKEPAVARYSEKLKSRQEQQGESES